MGNSADTRLIRLLMADAESAGAETEVVRCSIRYWLGDVLLQALSLSFRSFCVAVAGALMYGCPVISDELVYMSRVALPGFKDVKCAYKRYKKQVCIYVFTPQELTAFRKFGRKRELKHTEDIEILRFLELGKTIRMVETQPGSLAVDAPGDVAKVEAVLRKVNQVTA